MTTLREPNCGICGEPMTKLRRTTGIQLLAVFGCEHGKPGKGPCDGYLVEMAQRENPNLDPPASE